MAVACCGNCWHGDSLVAVVCVAAEAVSATGAEECVVLNWVAHWLPTQLRSHAQMPALHACLHGGAACLQMAWVVGPVYGCVVVC